MAERKPVQFPTTSDGYDKTQKIGFNAWKGVVANNPDVEVVLKLHHVDPSLDKERMKQSLALLSVYSQSGPGFVKGYSSFFSDNILWVVVDPKAWQEGNVKDLMTLASPDGLEESIIRAICAQLLAPLDFLHKNGRIFRDLKAKNIMMLPNGEVQLQLFTLPSILQDKAPTYRESLFWLAPEILPNREQKSAGPAADVWALGITMLEMALGQPPLQALDLAPPQILAQIADGPAPTLTPEQRSKFSKAFIDVISMCLDKNPARRATIADLQQHSWFKNAMKPDYIVENFLSKLPPFEERLKVFLSTNSQSHGGSTKGKPSSHAKTPRREKAPQRTSDDERIEQIPLEENDSEEDINTTAFDMDDDDLDNDEYESDDESQGSFTDDPTPPNSASQPVPTLARTLSAQTSRIAPQTTIATQIGSAPNTNPPIGPNATRPVTSISTAPGATPVASLGSPTTPASNPLATVPPMTLSAPVQQPPTASPTPAITSTAPATNTAATQAQAIPGSSTLTHTGSASTLSSTQPTPVPASAQIAPREPGPSSAATSTTTQSNPLAPTAPSTLTATNPGTQQTGSTAEQVRGRFKIVTQPGAANTATNPQPQTTINPPVVTAQQQSLPPLTTTPTPSPTPAPAPGAPKQIGAPIDNQTEQQALLINVPIETHLGETEKEYVIFIRALPGCVVRAALEGRTLVVSGTVPALPAALTRGITLLERPPSKFEKRIRFAAEIDPREPYVEMHRDQLLMIIRIKKQPQTVELAVETF